MGNKFIHSELTFTLQREQILGFTVISTISIGNLIICKAIENAVKVIAAGRYKLTLYASPKNKLVFLLHGVKGRKFVEIHVANYYYELEGCIAPCLYNSGAMGCNSRMALDKLFDIAKDYDSLYIEVKDVIPRNFA